MLYIVILIELTLCAGAAAYSVLKEPLANNQEPLAPHVTPQVPVVSKNVTVGLPVRLKIPKIKVNAALDQAGLTSNGELAAPKGPTTAAWYSHGPRPGDPGNAIINGHFGYRDHIPAVFDNLHTLQKGDTVTVEDEKGVSVTFVVRETRTYRSDADTASVFAPPDGRAHLNLITCQGVWNDTQKSFSARLVVFTDKITKKT